MTFKALLLTAVIGGLPLLSVSAHAQQSSNVILQSPINEGLNGSGFNVGEFYFNKKDTAAFYYGIGVKQYKAGKFEKAEHAFKSVIRAQKLKNRVALRRNSSFYLARIYEKQGEINLANFHAKEFFKLENKLS